MATLLLTVYLLGSVAVKVVLAMSSKVKSLSRVPRGLQTVATIDPVKVCSHRVSEATAKAKL